MKTPVRYMLWIPSLGSLLLLLAGCNDPDPETPPQLSLHFNEEFTIGFVTDSVEEFQLSHPSELRTDAEGHILIADQQSMDIKVFNAEGEFLHAFGGSGEGPGESRTITSMEINNQNELVIYDGMNARFTRFSTTADLLSVDPANGDLSVAPHHFQQIDGGEYLFLRKLRDTGAAATAEEQEIYSSVLHLHDETLLNRLQSFGNSTSLMESDADFVQHYAGLNPGHFWPAANGDIWYVPGIYNGRLFRFKKSSDRWEKSAEIEGNRVQSDAVDIDSNDDGAIQIMVYAPRQETYIGIVNSESLGVFTLADDRLIHFSAQLDGSERRLQIEVFNTNGEQIGVARLDAFTYDATDNRASVMSIWKDKEDRFYLIDRREEPIVRVGKLEGL